MVRRAGALQEKLGDDAMADLRGVIDDAGRQWRADVLDVAGERFERRLGAEIGALRIDMAKEFGVSRVEMTKEFAAVRADLAEVRFSTLKWAFVFWVSQFAAISGMMAFLLKTAGSR